MENTCFVCNEAFSSEETAIICNKCISKESVKDDNPNYQTPSLSVIRKTYGDSHIVIFATGKLDSLNALPLQKAIDNAFEDGWINIALNVSGVAFFSSAAIRVCISSYKKAASLGGCFFLTEPTKNITNILSMTALGKTLIR